MSRGLHGHNKKYFRQIPRESAGFKVTQNENFGLGQKQKQKVLKPTFEELPN